MLTVQHLTILRIKLLELSFKPETNGCNKEGSDSESGIIIPVQLKIQGRRKSYAVEMSCVLCWVCAASENAAQTQHRRSIDAIVNAADEKLKKSVYSQLGYCSVTQATGLSVMHGYDKTSNSAIDSSVG
jgi:hypothetical protein